MSQFSKRVVLIIVFIVFLHNCYILYRSTSTELDFEMYLELPLKSYKYANSSNIYEIQTISSSIFRKENSFEHPSDQLFNLDNSVDQTTQTLLMRWVKKTPVAKLKNNNKPVHYVNLINESKQWATKLEPISFISNIVEIDPPGFVFNKGVPIGPSSCHIRYPRNDELHFNNNYWQVLQTDYSTMYFYSAFYDKRELIGNISVIRILGIANSVNIGTKNDPLFCQFWFSGRSIVKVVKVTKSQSLWPWGKKEVRNMTHLPRMLTCPLTIEFKKLIPFAVSIVRKKCDRAVNKLRVIHNPPPTKAPSGFGVCVKGLDFPDIDIGIRLIEWFELLNLLGVSQIYLYLYEVSPSTKKVLDYYVKKGMVTVAPLTLPGHLPNNAGLRHKYFTRKIIRKRQLEILPYNDCLYRGMYRHKYLALMDIDEVIIPLKFKTWNDLLYTYEKNNSTRTKIVTSYQVKQNGCFFEGVERSWFEGIPKMAHMLQHVYKIPLDDQRFSIGTKPFILPSRVLVAFNHWPTSCLRRCHIVNMNSTDVHLQHYKHYRRHCGDKRTVYNTTRKSCKYLACINYKLDSTIWKYKSQLIPKFNQSYVAIFG